MKFTQLLSTSKNIYLILANQEGKQCYFFIRATPIQYGVIKRSFKKGRFDITKYGEVIASGWGHTPSDEVKKQIKEKYDFNVDSLQ